MPPAERWTEIQAALATVLELPEEQRAARIAALCGDDVELREEVERLLRACTAADAEGFLGDVISYASPVIAELERPGETSATAADELRDRLTLALEHRYRIERALGSGGMATVFLARDLRHDREVAVKVMQPGLLAGASAERFLREIRIVANLTHPHILPLHDSGQAAGLLYHVSAYIGGESLRARLRRDGALPVRDALRITREVATALDYAHRQRIVHRDIKPENVLIQDGHAVVADFGIARAFGHALGDNSGAAPTAITHEGLRLGTPAYMAPEQVTGSASADHRADLYALGLVAHEMLAGAHPFAGSTADELMVAQITRAPDRLVRADIPPALADVVLRLLEKRPDDRFQTAEQLLAELEQITLQPAPAGRSPAMSRAVPLSRSPATDGSITADLRPRRKRALLAVAVALPVLALLAMTARFSFERGRTGESAAVPLSDRTVAVAAFPGSSGAVTEEVDRVLRMAADWMGLGLMQTGLVTVVPIGALASGSDGAAGADATTLGAARAAGAGLVLLPSFHHVRDTVFLSARILRVSDGVMLRTAGPVTASLDAPLEGAEALRQRVTAALATLIDDRLANWSSGASQPTSFEAYQMFAEGLTAFFEPGQSRDPYPYFRRAHQLDTTFTAPLAWAFFVVGGAADDSIKQYLQARRSRLPPWDRGLLDWATRQNEEEGYQAFRRVVESAPQSEWLYMLAWTAEGTNRSAVAVRALESLDPDRGWMRYWPSYWWLLADSHHDLRQYEQELASARQMRTRFPWAPYLTTEARALAALGRTDELVIALADLRIDDSRTSFYDAGRQFARLILELRRHGYPELAARFTDRILLELESMEGRESREQLDELRMFILGAANRWVDAAPILERLSVDRPGGHRVLYFRARAAAFRGERAAAERLAQEARDLHLQRASRPQIVEGNYFLMLGTVNAMLGDRERAVALLKSAGVDRILPEYLHIQTGLESLIGYPPFDELASRRYDDPDFVPVAGVGRRTRQVRAR